MPNYIRVRLSFSGDKSQIKKLDELVKTETINDKNNIVGCVFDFNKIIPMPEELNITSGTQGDFGMRYLLLKAKHPITWNQDEIEFMRSAEKQKEKNPESFEASIELGKKYMENIVKFGHKDWYSWRIHNWGTKWNALESNIVYDINGELSEVDFETAWNFPDPIIQKLSELFPDVRVEFVYADEDTSYNTGTGVYEGGVLVDCEYPDSESKRAYELYFSTHPEYECDYRYDEELGTYVYIDEEDVPKIEE